MAARKPASQLSPAYAARLERERKRAEAAGEAFNRQRARGKKAGEARIRREREAARLNVPQDGITKAQGNYIKAFVDHIAQGADMDARQRRKLLSDMREYTTRAGYLTVSRYMQAVKHREKQAMKEVAQGRYIPIVGLGDYWDMVFNNPPREAGWYRRR